MQSLKNKVFVVTGAGSGIGRALALALDKEDAFLALNDVNQDALEQTASMLSKPCVSMAFSVAEAPAWGEFKSKLIERFGQIDGIINNAGIAHEAVAVEHMKPEDLKLVMDINFYGVVHGTQCFLSELCQRPESVIVNLSSIFGISAVNLQSAYCASKFAVRGFTESLRMEALNYYPNLTVSLVHPGGVQTNVAENAIRAGSRTDEERQKDLQIFKQTFITTPAQAAQTIIKGIQKKQSRIMVGMDAKFMDLVTRLMPVGYSKRILKQMKKNGLVEPSIIKPVDQRGG